MALISNQRLKPTQIPGQSADVDSLMRFALTFSGYDHCGSFEACARIANARSHDTLSDLRTCLYFEQRRWRHYGDAPDDEALSYWRKLVEKIRAKVQSGERE